MHNILLSVTDRETLLFFIIVSRKYFCIYGNSSTFLIIIQLFDYYIIIFTVFLRFLFICHTRWVRFHATNNDWLLSRKDLQNSQEILLPEHFLIKLQVDSPKETLSTNFIRETFRPTVFLWILQNFCVWKTPLGDCFYTLEYGNLLQLSTNILAISRSTNHNWFYEKLHSSKRVLR